MDKFYNNKIIISEIKNQTDLISGVKESLDKISELINSRLTMQIKNKNYIEPIVRFREGSKMLRSLLLLYTAKSTGNITGKHIIASAGIELIHTASLIHDDIVDQSDFRRLNPTLNACWGNKTAVVLGDLVLSLGLQMFSSLNDTVVMNLVTESMETVIHGELEQLCAGLPSESEYISAIDKKTGVLFGISMFLGSFLNGTPCETSAKWNKAGLLIGRTFQIMDDINDLKTTSNLKKKADTDLRNGIITLPVIYLLNTMAQPEIDLFITASQKPPADLIRRNIISSGALEKVRNKANCYLSEAEAILNGIAHRDMKPLFGKICELILNEIVL